MLRGHVFKYQTFSETAFAHFINIFLKNNIGVTKGCNLSHTTNSVTINEGFFCIYGRFLEVVGNETISNITNTGYYSLVCNVDLSKTNTKTQLLQAETAIVRNTSDYPSLTRENLDNGGIVYQYEFARFRVTDTGITDFQDRRTFLSLDSIYTTIQNEFNTLFEQKNQEAEILLEEIRQELENVLDGSAYLLKSGGIIEGVLKVLDGIEGNLTGNAGTATKLKQARTINIAGAVSGNADFDGSKNITINVEQTLVKKLTKTLTMSTTTAETTFDYPSGYGPTTCAVLACGALDNTDMTNPAYTFGDTDINNVTLKCSVNLAADSIHVKITRGKNNSMLTLVLVLIKI